MLETSRGRTAALTLALALPTVALDAGEELPRFKLHLERGGIYRVTFEDLAASRPGLQPLALAGLSLSRGGEAIPVWVDGEADGVFGPGDSFEFVGDHLRGEISYFHEYSRDNVYRLRFDGEPLPVTPVEPLLEEPWGAPATLYAAKHLEEESLLLRFRERPEGPRQEAWFWARLTHQDTEPFRVEFDAPGLHETSGRTVRLRIHLRGWSSPKKEWPIPDHRVEVRLNGKRIGMTTWQDQDVHLLERQVQTTALLPQGNLLEVRVPPRGGADGGDPLIDVVLLNWVEIDYPATPRVVRNQTELRVHRGNRVVELEPGVDGSLVVHLDRAARLVPSPGDPYRFYLDGNAREIHVAAADSLRSPRIAVDAPSDLRARSRQADYLIVSHGSLLGEIERLAAFHRERGLTVEVVDVEDVYDEFGHGIVHPRAIRDFVAHAYHDWLRPRPRFLLLVGDASWDVHNERPDDSRYVDWTYRPFNRNIFRKNASTPYGEGELRAERNLIPTGTFRSAEGHAASDNYFVTVEGEDFHPDLAVGRLPVINPEEVAAIVDKSIRYARDAGVGPWRRRLLWITNERDSFQRRSDAVNRELLDSGLASRKVYPTAGEPGTEAHQAALLEALDQGLLLVHFYGHGGRYIWRTAAADFDKGHDLFTLDHLDRLRPSERLPVVLSLTCFSAPFDHPTADSIGEKFLRIEERGAVAVFAASWRNLPAFDLSRALMRELTRRQSIGEAILKAKRAIPRQDLSETYNLLGDPALPLAVPPRTVAVESAGRERNSLTVLARMTGKAFEGTAVIDWVDADGSTLLSRQTPWRKPLLKARIPVSREIAAAAAAVNIYVWNEELQRDGMGGRLLADEPATTAAVEP